MNWNTNFNLQIIEVSGRGKNKNGQEELFKEMEINFPELKRKAIAGVAQWVECQPVNQLGHAPGLWARSLVWGMRQAHDVSPTHQYFSPSHSPSIPCL